MLVALAGLYSFHKFSANVRISIHLILCRYFINRSISDIRLFFLLLLRLHVNVFVCVCVFVFVVAHRTITTIQCVGILISKLNKLVIETVKNERFVARARLFIIYFVILFFFLLCYQRFCCRCENTTKTLLTTSL